MLKTRPGERANSVYLSSITCSVGIFTREEVAVIVDYVTNSYYRHFQLYKCIYTPYYHVHLVQREINDIQTPKAPRPLSHGYLHSTRSLPSIESTGTLDKDEVAAVETTETPSDA